MSVATVSRTFAKPDIVTEATRKKVIEAANELDFVISRSATALKSKHTFHIAMLTGEAIATWFDSNLYKGLTEVLQTHGYDVSLYGIADTELAHVVLRRAAPAPQCRRGDRGLVQRNHGGDLQTCRAWACR